MFNGKPLDLAFTSFFFGGGCNSGGGGGGFFRMLLGNGFRSTGGGRGSGFASQCELRWELLGSVGLVCGMWSLK